MDPALAVAQTRVPIKFVKSRGTRFQLVFRKNQLVRHCLAQTWMRIALGMGSVIPIRPTTYTVTRKLIRDKIARIGVVGLGHVGLPLALMFTGSGLVVEGFDVDAEKVEKLSDRQSYLRSIAPEEISIARVRGFHATTDLSQISEMDAVVLCVPTRLTAEQEPDVIFIRETAFSIAPYLHAGQLIVIEGTTYPGTTQEVVLPILESANCANLRVSRNTARNDEVFLAFSSEYRDQGDTTVDRRDVPKVISGVDQFSMQLATDLYQSVFTRVIPVSTSAAEEMFPC
jgi:UDP-N-acetyl-D-glucosamine dehydrogenase